MAQKEIIHLSFGPIANHISTHYWNAQESYFDYAAGPSRHARREDDMEEDEQALPLVDHDVSFREGIAPDGEQTYCPRTMVFETADEMGGLRKVSELYESLDSTDDAEETALATWSRPAVRYQSRPAIPKSAYHQRLERGEEDSSSDLSEEDELEAEERQLRVPGEASGRTQSSRRNRSRQTGPRFWSDYTRVFLHPRSSITVGGQFLAPMTGSTATSHGGTETQPQDGRARFESWEMGVTTKNDMEREQDTMDGGLRWFAEDSDLLQAFNVVTSTSDAFSGFSASYIESLADEYSKTPIVVWGAQWGEEDDQLEGERARLARIRTMNNVLSLANLPTHAAIYTPLLVPELSSLASDQSSWAQHLQRMNVHDIANAAALLCAHLDTATLSSRLRARPETMASLTSRLNWRRDTPIATLGGCSPTPLLAPVQDEDAPMDPIEALLAAKGLMPSKRDLRDRNGGHQSADELAEQGAKELSKAWCDFSNAPHKNTDRPFAVNLMARHGQELAKAPTLAAAQEFCGISQPLGMSHFAQLPFNILSSYPQMFSGLTSDGQPLPAGSKSRPKVRSLPLLSTWSTSPSSVETLRRGKRFINQAITGHGPLAMYGIGSGASGMGAGAASSEENDGAVGGRDGLKEVRERLEELLSAYEGEAAEEQGEDGKDADEEWEEAEDEAWDL